MTIANWSEYAAFVFSENPYNKIGNETVEAPVGYIVYLIIQGRDNTSIALIVPVFDQQIDMHHQEKQKFNWGNMS